MASERSESIDFEQWKRDCAYQQQSLYLRFGDRDWDSLPKSDLEIIRTKVSLFLLNKDYRYLEEKEQSSIDKTVNKLLELTGSDKHLLLGCAYVNVLFKKKNSPSIIPVLRTKKDNAEEIFFYEFYSNRVYRSWVAFEEDNKLPKCHMCYPVRGFYRHVGQDKRVQLKLRLSPSCDNILPVVDIISLIGGGICTGILAVSAFFPPILAAEVAVLSAGGGVIATSLYTATREIFNIVDRDKHGQSLSLGDPEAFRNWLSIILSFGSMFTAGGVAVVRGAALKGVGAALNSSNVRLACTIMRYTSVGVNSFGMFAVIVNLVMNFRENGPDLYQFVSLVLFITNIVISTTQGEHLLQAMIEQPDRMRFAFNMIRNTPTAIVKGIVKNVPFSDLLDLITGEQSMNFLRLVGVNRTAEMITYIRNRIRRCNSGGDDTFLTLVDLFQKCFPLLGELCSEVKTAVYKIERWFNSNFKSIRIGRQPLSGNLAMQITNEIEQVADGVNLRDLQYREEVAEKTVSLVNSVANETIKCDSPAEYMEICEFVCCKALSLYDTESIIEECEGSKYQTDQKKKEIFCKIIAKLEQQEERESVAIDYWQKRKQLSACCNTFIFDKPVFQTEETSVYYFEASSKFSTFSQFVHDAVCELLATDEFFSETREFHLHPRETLFVVRDGNKSLIFFYEIRERENKTVGFVMVDEKKNEDQ